MTFTDDMRMAAKIMRERKPVTLEGIFECALAEGCSHDHADKVVAAHYKNLRNQDYRAVAGLSKQDTN